METMHQRKLLSIQFTEQIATQTKGSNALVKTEKLAIITVYC